MEILYKQIKAELTHGLRQKILRPHQPIQEMVYPLDDLQGSYHVGAFFDEALVGIASIFPEAQSGELHNGHWRIRGMAVEEDFRGKNIGQELVHNCIEYIKGQEATEVWCNARTSAIGFYYALGFKQFGEEFEIEGIGPHYVARLSF